MTPKKVENGWTCIAYQNIHVVVVVSGGLYNFFCKNIFNVNKRKKFNNSVATMNFFPHIDASNP